MSVAPTARRTAAGLAALLATASGAGLAQPRYPERPVRVVIPFAPGGNTDLLGRRFAARLSPLLGQNLVVDNRGGAGGNIGAAEVARAKPDGYTLLIGTSSTHALNPLTFDNMPYDPVKDFAPVSVLGISHMVIAVHPTIARTLPELVGRVKAQPGKFSYGSSGLRTNVHLTGELFVRQAGGLDLLHVPYKGGGQAVQETIAGQIPVVITAVSSATPYHRGGRLRILAVFSEARSKALPEVPTAIESGIPGMLSSSLNVLFAPAHTPRAVIDQLHHATTRVAADAAFQADLDTLGMDPVPDATPERTLQLLKDEIARWTPVVLAAGMAPARTQR